MALNRTSVVQLYPAHATQSLEFDQINNLLLSYCRSDEAKHRVTHIRFHTKKDIIYQALTQTEEYKQILLSKGHFPNDFTDNLQKELKLLSIAGAALQGTQLLMIRKLALTIRDILHWFSIHPNLYPSLRVIIEKITYEAQIDQYIAQVIDDNGNVKDNASKALETIRSEIETVRQETRRAFESVLRKLQKQGYLAEISEGFLNGRRTVAVWAEHKRIVRGIFHGESDSRRIVFIEPEETIAYNNELVSLEREEAREVQRILAETTALIAPYHSLLVQYYRICGIFDFIRAKAMLAVSMNANLPRFSHHPITHLIQAYHPLLWLQHTSSQKEVIPMDISLDTKNRILVISGPNAGGKTVSMKTVGLLQLMFQAGLLIPADPRSEMGIYRQLMIQIGDTQSIAQELSTYSAHLKDMKHFMDFADAKTLFFIDELGSGSDPGLGGAFAEAILEELARKQAKGIVTTHYMNLKTMAGKVPGIINGAMSFDEAGLVPLYKLQIGKPGSSYTFAVARRSGLPEKIINRAQQLADKRHFELDRMLHNVEHRMQELQKMERKAAKLIQENERLKKQYEELSDKERIKQQHALLKLQNQIKKEELTYLRDMERKFRQIIRDWKTAENKAEVIDAAEKILFRKKEIKLKQAAAHKADKSYTPTGSEIVVGGLVRNIHTHQIGQVQEVREKNLIVRMGKLPFTVKKDEWIAVAKKEKNDHSTTSE